MAYKYNRILVIKLGVPIHATTWVKLENIMLNEKVTKGHIWFQFMKCLEKANPERQVVDWWLPRAGKVRGKWGVTANE